MRRRACARFATLTCLLAAAFFVPPSNAEEDASYSRTYRSGRLAHLAGSHRNAVILLLEAISRHPVEGEPWVRLYGRNRAPYLPHYYLGASLFELGEYAAALRAFGESERQGAVLEAEEARTLRAYREVLRTEIVPALLTDTRAEAAAVRRLLADVETIVDPRGPEAERTVNQARTRLAAIDLEIGNLGASGDLEAFRTAGESLAQVEKELSAVLVTAERSRRSSALRRRDERLAELLTADRAECDRQRFRSLTEVLESDLPLDGRREIFARLELADAAVACAEIAGARRELERIAARLVSQGVRAERTPDLESRAAALAAEIDRREKEAAWEEWIDLAGSANCEVETMDRLERLADANLARWPATPESLVSAPHLELASLRLSCGDLHAAEALFAAAEAAHEGDEAERREMADALAASRESRARQRRLDEVTRSVDLALGRLTGRSACASDVLVEGRELRAELAGVEDIEARVIASLDLGLARASLACGDLDGAALHLAAVENQPAAGSAETEALAFEIGARRLAAAREAEQTDSLARLDAALELLSNGSCSATAITLLEGLDREGWRGGASHPPEIVLLSLVRARLACRDIQAAAMLLARPELTSPAISESSSALRAEVRALEFAAARSARRSALEADIGSRLSEVSGEGCREAGWRALQAVVESNARELAGLEIPVTPYYVELARAQLACGELEAASAALAVARARGADARVEGLSSVVARELSRRLERERWEGLLERYVEAVMAVDLDQCERTAVEALLEVAALSAEDPLLRWIGDISGVSHSARIDLARALASCGEVERARSELRRASALDGGVDPAVQREVERRLLEREARKLYRGRYALLVGASDYARHRGGWWNLDGVRRDVESIGAALGAAGFDAVRVVEAPATAVRIRAAVESFLVEFGGADNLLLFYFAGHGETLSGRLAQDDGSYDFKAGYFVPEDAPRPNGTGDSRDRFLELAVGMDEVDRWARSIVAKHVLFLFDTCFSGTVFRAVARGRGLLLVDGEGKNEGSALPPLVLARASKPVRLFATAGAEDQVVPDESVFRRLLVEALAGLRPDADFTRDGFLMGRELCLFLEDQVAIETGNMQTPQCGTMPPPFNEGDVIFGLPAGNREAETSRREELRQDAAAWRSARSERDGIERYLERFPAGRFAGIARLLALRVGASAIAGAPRSP